VRIAEPEDNFGGDHERNLVNRLTAKGGSGIQIEQSPWVATRTPRPRWLPILGRWPPAPSVSRVPWNYPTSTRDEPVNLSDSCPGTHQHWPPADANCCQSLLLDPGAMIRIDLHKRLFLLVTGRGE
jgi:hypothetical protein